LFHKLGERISKIREKKLGLEGLEGTNGRRKESLTEPWGRTNAELRSLDGVEGGGK